jgi:hypothetical protein
MFKLIRIYNSTTGVPDMVPCFVQSNVEIKAGNAYALQYDGLSETYSYGDKIFVACESAEAQAGIVPVVRCYEALPGMEFEAKCAEASKDNIKIGYQATINNEEGETKIALAEDGAFIVSDIFNTDDGLTVRVKVI